MAKAAQENPLALVDFWSVDTDWDGRVFRPDASFYRDRKGLCTRAELEVEADGGRFAENRKIAVRTVDVLGNIGFDVMDGGKIFG